MIGYRPITSTALTALSGPTNTHGHSSRRIRPVPVDPLHSPDTDVYLCPAHAAALPHPSLPGGYHFLPTTSEKESS